MILGFDPGRDKCGVAVMDSNRQVWFHEVVPAASAVSTIQELVPRFKIELVVMGDLTTSKAWHQELSSALSGVAITMVDEKNSTLEARDRYWQMYPPTGIKKLIPQGLRLPPRPIDDIVAILLIERYLLI